MSKKRLNYDFDTPWFDGVFNSKVLNMKSKSGDYLNDYAQALDAMRGNAVNATNMAVRKGKAFSQVDAMKAQMEYASTLEERAYNEYLYNQYESPAAMVKQYDEAGLNGMLLAGGNSVGGSVNATSGNSMSLGRGNESARGLDIMGMILNAVMGAAGQVANFKNAESQRISADANANKAASDVAVNQAQEDKIRAEERGIDLDNQRKEQELPYVQKMLEVNYQLLSTNLDRQEFENELRYKYGEIMTQKEFEEISSKIKVNEATADKLRADISNETRMTNAQIEKISHEVNLIDQECITQSEEAAFKRAETALKELVTTDQELAIKAEKLCQTYGIRTDMPDLVYQALGAQAAYESGEMSKLEFDCMMGTLNTKSVQRGKGDRAQKWISTTVGVGGTLVAAYLGAKGGKGPSSQPTYTPVPKGTSYQSSGPLSNATVTY